MIGKGTWQGIISEDEHRGVVALLSDPTRRPATVFERKHMGSGVYRCSVCDGSLYAMFPSRARPMLYACKPHRHVGRLAAPLDELVTAVVPERLRRNDIGSQLTPRQDFDVTAMHTQRAALQARADELARLFAKGSIGGSQLESGTATLRQQIAGIDAVLADAVASSPAIQLLDGDPDELETSSAATSPDIKGKIVNELMTVTVLPTPRGVKGVDRDGMINTEYIRIEWKTA